MGDKTSAQPNADHHEPAIDDWPSGSSETSVWPFIAAFGVATIYAGAALLGMSFGSDAIFPRWPGTIILIGGVGVFVVGAFGWLYHGFIHHYWTRETNQHTSLTLRTAMLLFIVTEVATFGAGFTYYFYIRVRPWPPEPLPQLLSSLILVNTLLLVASSVTLHFAHRAIRENKHDRFKRLTGVTILLGSMFLAGQVYEYYEFVVIEGFTITSGLFANAFFGLTGLHGLHVTLGVILLSIVFIRGWVLDQYSQKRMTSISTTSMYWHFVDGIWLFLVTSIYIGGSIPFP